MWPIFFIILVSIECNFGVPPVMKTPEQFVTGIVNYVKQSDDVPIQEDVTVNYQNKLKFQPHFVELGLRSFHYVFSQSYFHFSLTSFREDQAYFTMKVQMYGANTLQSLEINYLVVNGNDLEDTVYQVNYHDISQTVFGNRTTKFQYQFWDQLQDNENVKKLLINPYSAFLYMAQECYDYNLSAQILNTTHYEVKVDSSCKQNIFNIYFITHILDMTSLNEKFDFMFGFYTALQDSVSAVTFVDGFEGVFFTGLSHFKVSFDEQNVDFKFENRIENGSLSLNYDNMQQFTFFYFTIGKYLCPDDYPFAMNSTLCGKCPTFEKPYLWETDSLCHICPIQKPFLLNSSCVETCPLNHIILDQLYKCLEIIGEVKEKKSEEDFKLTNHINNENIKLIKSIGIVASSIILLVLLFFVIKNSCLNQVQNSEPLEEKKQFDKSLCNQSRNDSIVELQKDKKKNKQLSVIKRRDNKKTQKVKYAKNSWVGQKQTRHTNKFNQKQN